MIPATTLCDNSCCCILRSLKTLNLGIWEAKKETIAIVNPRQDKRHSNGCRSLSCNVGSYLAKTANVIEAGLHHVRDVLF
jgi:hypothetical protein